MSKSIITKNKFKSMFGEHFINYGVLDDLNGELVFAPIGILNSFYGKHHTKETKKDIAKKISVLQSGKNNAMYGSKRFGELNPMYGRKHSEETKRKMRKNSPSYNGELNPMYGRKHSEEAKKKMSIAKLKYYANPRALKTIHQEEIQR
jgi:hypothetical protein